jgi:uncharacterized protein YbbC (DUF1343 family)
VRIGLELLATDPMMAKSWGNCLLLCNQASVTSTFKPAWEVVREVLGDKLIGFFGPQHGFHSTVQDNMIETGDGLGPYGLPVYSLYSDTREPSEQMLEGADTILIDIQIVGCRVYTFKYTIAACLRAAKKYGKKVVILDRPNPMGGRLVEGRVLELAAKSFVGEFEIPMRHGLTPAEAGLLFNKNINADLEIIKLEGWDSTGSWRETNRDWVLTSPNLPTFDSVALYPGTVIFEGTNVSEGRGTTLPFQFIGAPYIKDADKFVKRVKEYYDCKGVYYRPVEFMPTSQKFANEVCFGTQLHVLDDQKIDSYKLGLALLYSSIDLGGKEFKWKEAGYEYDYDNNPVDLILGKIGVNSDLMNKTIDFEDSFWSAGISKFISDASSILLYDREQVLNPY